MPGSASYFQGNMAELPENAQFSEGPTPGFGQAFMAAYNDTATRLTSWGAEGAFDDLQQQQLDKVYELTGERLRPLTFTQNVVRALSGETLDADQAKEYAEQQKQMQKLTAIAASHPGILDYQGMWKQVVQQAHEYAQNEQDVSSHVGVPGWLGGFAGNAAASMREPSNILSLLFGGLGKTALTRVVTEMGVQGASQALAEFTGVNENQRELGFTPSTGEAIERVAGAAGGAGIAVGAGEAVSAGTRALFSRFGAKGADIATGVASKELEDAIGPSPYGKSRAAQGLHEAEVADAVKRDTPLNVPVAGATTLDPKFSIATLASRDSDNIFNGTSEPLSRVFDRLPAESDAAAPVVASANKTLTDLTGKIKEADAQTAAFADELKARSDDVPDSTAAKAKLDEVNSAIAATSDKRKLGRLNKERAALEDTISQAEAAAADMKALAGKRDAAGQVADDLRLKRAQIVAEAAKQTPDLNRRAAATSLAETMGDERPPTQDRLPANADEVEAETKAEPIAPPEPKLLPPPENAPEGASETVDLGQKGEPPSLDDMIATGTDDEGNLVYTSIRDILKGHADDADLVKSMKECLL